MFELTIASEKKGRAFSATCVAAVEANALWTGGMSGDTHRPVWAMFAGTEQQLRPFVANLQLGRKADTTDPWGRNRGGDANRYEFLRSAGYLWTWQREVEGCLVTAYLPDLFRLDPGMVDVTCARFVLLVPRAWAGTAAADLEVASIVSHAKRFGYPINDIASWLVPTSHLFAAYLDRRTRCPLVADGRFYLQLLCACLDKGLATWAGPDSPYHHDRAWGQHAGMGFTERGVADVGLLPPIAFNATHEQIEAVLAAEVEQFFKLTDAPKRARNAG